MFTTDERNHEFLLMFDSATDLQRAVRLKGTERGLFFQTDRPVSAGDWVLIRANVRALRSGVWLEGRVAWRRVSTGLPLVPAGVFVGLTPQALGLVDDVIRYLSSAGGQSDRRIEKRHFVLLEASYRTVDGKFRAEIRNLSGGGACLRCRDVPPLAGSDLLVTLHAEGTGRRGTRLPALVAWNEASQDFCCMGIRFKPTWWARRRLDRTLDRLERNPPSIACGRRPW